MKIDDLKYEFHKEMLDKVPIRSKEISKNDEMEIAVIGLDCRFPEAANAKEFWINIRNGVDNIHHYPENRQKDVDNYINRVAGKFVDKTYIEGGFLEEVDKFDYSFFKLTPNEAKLLSPNQRLFLEVSWKALEDAGYISQYTSKESNIGVYVGASKSIFDYERMVSTVIKDNYSDYAVGNLSAMIAGRVSYTLNLKGPSVTIDTACSSSLVAIHTACRDIMHGECDMAIAGGIKINLFPLKSSIGIESSDDRAKVFDEESDGTGCGEGVAAVILKPLTKAIQDNDHIYGVIKSSAVNQDGKTAGITVPNSISQTELLCKCWDKINLNPESITYIEAHGTGTKLGDPIEIVGINKAFAKYTDKKHFCGIGSVKANIGHLYEGAGIAGFIKLLLMMKYKEIPPVVHLKNINKKIDIEDGPIYIPKQLKKWDDSTTPLRCGVSSFGLSGTNCHMILEEYNKKVDTVTNSHNIFLLSAKTEKSLYKLIDEYIQFLEEEDEKIDNICYMAAVHRSHYPYRIAIVVKSTDELLNQLKVISNTRDEINSDNLHMGRFKVILNNNDKSEEYEVTNNELLEIGKRANDVVKANEKIHDNIPDLNRICNYFIKGGEIDWTLLYPHKKYTKISIPTYCFEKRRCWVNVNTEDIDISLDTCIEDRIPQDTYGRESVTTEGVHVIESAKKQKIMDDVNKIISKISGFGIDEIDNNTAFLDMGLDSIGLMKVKNAIKSVFQIDIPVSEFFSNLSSVIKVSDHLSQFVMTDHENELDNEKNQNRISNNLRQEILENSNMSSDAVHIMNRQLHIMEMQLRVLSGKPNDYGYGGINQSIQGEAKTKNDTLYKANSSISKPSNTFKPYKKSDFQVETHLTLEQSKYLQDIIYGYCKKTQGSKDNIQKYRMVYANNRNIAGFRPILKEMVYQLVSPKAKGSKIWDVDDNEYIDLTMGFGVNLFGHNPDFITEAIGKQLEEGFSLGPMSHMAGKVAKKICQLTGVERVAFYNSGTEANMVAMRIARAVTNRKKIVIFSGSYHGTFDGVLGLQGMEPSQTMPMAPGILDNMVKDLYVLDYGTDESMKFIQQNANEIAGVLVETVQSRRPDFTPIDFIKELRKVTNENNIALIFDEVITGFRFHNRGAQEFYNVKADIITYGKVIGGGLPIGVVSGSAHFLDSIDGGFWKFGDESYPQRENIRTFVAGTFCHHPLAMAASYAVLERLAENHIQEALNEKTGRFAREMNQFFLEENVPIQIVHFGSLFRFVLQGDLELFYYILVHKGIYIWEGRNCFFSTEHTDEDIRKLISIIKEAIGEMKAHGFITMEKYEHKNSIKLALLDEQKEIWNGIAYNNKVSLACNQTVVLNLEGDLNCDVIGQALQVIVQRHEAIRTSIDKNGEYQIIEQDANIKVEFTDISQDNNQDEILKEIVETEKYQEFILHKAPLIRLHIVKLNGLNYKLIFTSHHILFDGWSMNVILSELAAVYSSIIQNKESDVTTATQFREFINWKHKLLEKPDFSHTCSFWKDTFNTLDQIALLPKKKDFIHGDVSQEAQIHFTLTKDETDKLLRVSKNSGNTLFMTLMTGFMSFLYKLTSTNTTVISVPFAGQTVYEAYNLVGQCNTLLPVCYYIDGSSSFKANAKGLKEIFLNVVKHQNYSINSMLNQLDISKVPNLDIIFNMDKVTLPVFDGLQTHMGSEETNYCNHALFINIMQVEGALEIQFKYNTNYFDDVVVKEWCLNYKNILEYITDYDEVLVDDIPIHLEMTNEYCVVHNQQVGDKIMDRPLLDSEKKLFNIWEDIFGHKLKTVDDDFLLLGGNSLKIMALRSKIQKEFNVEINIKDLFENRTIKKIAKLIDKQEHCKYQMIKVAQEKDYYPVTAMQKGLYISNQLDKESTKYNIHGGLVIYDDVDIPLVNHCLTVISKRHQILRTSFFREADTVYQFIQEDKDIEVDVRVVESEEAAHKIIKEFIRPFNMEEGNLFNVILLQIEGNKNILFCDLHHSIADGYSAVIFFEEFLRLYNGQSLEKLDIQYKDYATHMHASYQKENYKKQESYWLNEFADGVPRVELPFQQARSETQDTICSTIRIEAHKQLLDSVHDLASTLDTTTFTILLAAYYVLIAKYSNKENIVIGVPVDGREYTEITQLIGMFVNTLCIKNAPKGNKTFSEFVSEVKGKLMLAMNNQDYSYEQLVSHLLVERLENRTGLVDFLFTMQNNDHDTIKKFGNQYEKYEMDIQNIDFDIAFNYYEDQNGLCFIVDYASKLYRKRDIEIFARRYLLLLERLIKQYNTPIHMINFMKEEEKEYILQMLSTPKDITRSQKTIKELFEEQVDKDPQAIAISMVMSKNNRLSTQSLTYRELNNKSNQLARLLLLYGSTVESTVGIICKNSLEMMVSVLAVFKSGAAYVPLNPELPAERLAYMIRQSNIKTVLVQDHTQVQKVIEEVREIYSDFGTVQMESYGEILDTRNLDVNPKLNDLAYIIYTSGTTGKPKGVLIEQGSIGSTIEWRKQEYQMDYREHVLQLFNFSFDGFLTSALTPLIAGSRLILLEEEDTKDVHKILQIVREQHITHFIAVPTLYRALLNVASEDIFSHLKIITLAGEKVTQSIVCDSHGINPKIEIVNEYGPTENSVVTTIKRNLKDDEHITIGKPVPQTGVYILDKYQHVQPIGVEGEICISGRKLARKYISDDPEVNKRFILNPYSKMEKLYCTGDMGRWLENGEIDFIGRCDKQLNIKGYRVEVSEIENVMLKHEQIDQCIIVPRTNNMKVIDLYGYYVSNRKVLVNEIKEYLRRFLPDYMVPAFLIEVDSMPFTSTGKIDKNKLLAIPLPQKHDNGFEVPMTKEEEILSEVWSQVLNINEISVLDNFFQIGGDSIKAIQVVASCNQKGLHLTTKDIMKKQTIRKIAQHVEKSVVRLNQDTVVGNVRLTPIQKWFFDNITVDRHHFNQAILVKNKQKFHLSSLEKTMAMLIERHDALRMKYDVSGDDIQQYNEDINERLMPIEVMLINEENVLEIIYEDSNKLQENMHLEDGNLITMKVYQTLEEDYLFVMIHHLVTDGVSWRILIEDICNIYQSLVENRQLYLTPKTSSYQEWSQALYEHAQTYQVKREHSYWERICNKTYNSIGSKTITPNRVEDTGVLKRELEDMDMFRLQQKVNKPYSTKTLEILFAAFSLTLKDYFGKGRYLIDMENHGRGFIESDIDVSRTVGWFTAAYPLDINTSKLEDTSQAIMYIKEKIRRIPNNGLNYGVLKYLTEDVDQRQYHLDQVKSEIIFNYLGEINHLSTHENLEVIDYNYGITRSSKQKKQHVLEIDILIIDKKINLYIHYNNKCFSNEQIEIFSNIYNSKLKELVDHCIAQQEVMYTPSDFDNTTLDMAELSSLLHKHNNNIEKIYDLTPMQKGMLFDYQFKKESHTYFEQVVLDLRGQVHVNILEEAFNKVIEKNDGLRTCFEYKLCDEPQQVILKNYTIRIVSIDMTNTKDDQQYEVESYCKLDIQKGFELSERVPMRLALIRLSKNHYKLVWSFHHILMDGWCIDIILKAIVEYYKNKIKGISIELPDAPSYANYQQWISKQDKEEALLYWENYLDEYHEIVTMKDDPNDFMNRGEIDRKELNFVINETLKEGIQRIAKKEQLTLASLFQSLWGVLLNKLFNHNDIVFGVVVSGRNPQIQNIEHIVGLFINTIPLRIKLDSQSTIISIAKRVQEDIERGNTYGYVSLAQIQSRLDLDGVLFDNMVSYENYANYNNYSNRLGNESELGFQLESISEFEQTIYNISFIVEPKDKQFDIKVIYNDLTCNKDTIDKIEQVFIQLIEQFISNNDVKTSEMEVVPKQEVLELLNDFMADF